MECFNCGKSPGQHGVTLLRQNQKGEVGVWACEACNQKPVDPELFEVVGIAQAALRSVSEKGQ